jgi:hypothetical protein
MNKIAKATWVSLAILVVIVLITFLATRVGR